MIEAWHFIQKDRKLRFPPYTEITVGETLTCDPALLVPCQFGFHGSERAINTLTYLSWSDAVLCRVRLGGRIIPHGGDKLCASERTVLWWADADQTLFEFACWSVDQAIPLWVAQYPNDDRPQKAIAARRGWLAGMVTDAELAAAYAAANAANAAYAAAANAAADADARTKTLAKCADIVRGFYPKPPQGQPTTKGGNGNGNRVG